MNEKIERYKEYMIRETVRLNLKFLLEINEMHVVEKEKASTRTLIENAIKSQLLMYIDGYSDFSVMEFVTTSKTLFGIYKSLGHSKCETIKEAHTIQESPIF